MKPLIGILLTTAFLALTTLSGRFISNAETSAELCWAIMLLFLGQSCLWAGGEFVPGVGKRLGIWRGLAMVVFIMQTLTVPFVVFQIIWGRTAQVRSDEAGVLTRFQLTWALCGGLAAAFFLFLARKRWLSNRESAPSRAT